MAANPWDLMDEEGTPLRGPGAAAYLRPRVPAVRAGAGVPRPGVGGPGDYVRQAKQRVADWRAGPQAPRGSGTGYSAAAREPARAESGGGGAGAVDWVPRFQPLPTEDSEERSKGSAGLFGGAADFARGAARGLVGLPEMVGQTGEFAERAAADAPVKDAAFSGLADIGERAEEAAPWLRESRAGQAEEGALSVRGMAYEGGETMAQSLGPAAVGAAAGAALGSVVPGIGTAAGAIGGAAVGFFGALPLFGGSQANDTYERVFEAQREAGVDERTAHEEALTAGAINGSIEVGGELASNLVTAGLARFLPRGVKGDLVRSLVGNKGNYWNAVKYMGTRALPAELATEMGQAVSQAEVEEAYGAGEGATLDLALRTVVPTMMLVGISGNVAHAIGEKRRESILGMPRQQIQDVLADAEAPVEERARAMAGVEVELGKVDPDLAAVWNRYAAKAIVEGAPMVSGETDAYYRDLVGRMEAGEDVFAPDRRAFEAVAEAQPAGPQEGVDEAAPVTVDEVDPETGEVFTKTGPPIGAGSDLADVASAVVDAGVSPAQVSAVLLDEGRSEQEKADQLGLWLRAAQGVGDEGEAGLRAGVGAGEEVPGGTGGRETIAAGRGDEEGVAATVPADVRPVAAPADDGGRAQLGVPTVVTDGRPAPVAEVGAVSGEGGKVLIPARAPVTDAAGNRQEVGRGDRVVYSVKNRGKGRARHGETSRFLGEVVGVINGQVRVQPLERDGKPVQKARARVVSRVEQVIPAGDRRAEVGGIDGQTEVTPAVSGVAGQGLEVGDTAEMPGGTEHPVGAGGADVAGRSEKPKAAVAPVREMAGIGEEDNGGAGAQVPVPATDGGVAGRAEEVADATEATTAAETSEEAAAAVAPGGDGIAVGAQAGLGARVKQAWVTTRDLDRTSGRRPGSTIPSGYARLADLHEALPDVPLAELHAELARLEAKRRVRLYPIENGRDLTPADRDARIAFGDPQNPVGVRHLVQFLDDDGGTAPGATGGAAAAGTDEGAKRPMPAAAVAGEERSGGAPGSAVSEGSPGQSRAELVVDKGGAPFKTQLLARKALRRVGRTETHEVVPHEAGFAVRRRVPFDDTQAGRLEKGMRLERQFERKNGRTGGERIVVTKVTGGKAAEAAEAAEAVFYRRTHYMDRRGVWRQEDRGDVRQLSGEEFRERFKLDAGGRALSDADVAGISSPAAWQPKKVPAMAAAVAGEATGAGAGAVDAAASEAHTEQVGPQGETGQGARTGAPVKSGKTLTERLTAYADEQDALADQWANKKYKPNATMIELEGDGPANTPEMSIGNINESRRRKRVQEHRNNAAMIRSYINDKNHTDQERLRTYVGIWKDVQEGFDGSLLKDMTKKQWVVEQLNRKLFDMAGFFGPGTPGAAVMDAMEPLRKAQEAKAAEEEAKAKAERAEWESKSEEEKAAFWDDFLGLNTAPSATPTTPEIPSAVKNTEASQADENVRPQSRPPMGEGQGSELPAQKGGKGVRQGRQGTEREAGAVETEPDPFATVEFDADNVLQHPLLPTKAYRETIRALAEKAGWAEVGGKLLRDMDGKVTGRTPWVPYEPWWTDKPSGVTERHVVSMAAKLNDLDGGEVLKPGAKLLANERRALAFLVDVADLDGRSFAEDLSSELEEESVDTRAIAEVMARAEAALGEKAVEAIKERVAIASEDKSPAEYNEDLIGALNDAIQKDAGDARGRDGDRADEEKAEFALAGETEEDLRSRETEAKRRQEAELNEEHKAKADEEVGGFVLAGSDRDVDQAEARGQENLFDAKEVQAAAGPQGDVDKGVTLARDLAKRLATGEKLPWRELFRIANGVYGGTQAQGAYTSKDAYDAMELGLNLRVRELFDGATTSTPGQLRAQLVMLEELQGLLPTQSKRTEEQKDLQQFSTPHTHSLVAGWVASILPGDVVLEPSAGTGNLAVHAKRWGPRRVIANELSERRRKMVGELADEVYGENAEHLHALLPKTVRPTVVVMNPPFSANVNRRGRKDLLVGAKHVEVALQRLEPGGRLVAILGRGMRLDAPRTMAWWHKIRTGYRVRANIGISGAEYAKFGTSFDNRMVVIDKRDPDGVEPVTGEVARVEQLIPLLEGIHNDRVPADERASDQPGRKEGAATARGEGRGSTTVQPSVDVEGGAAQGRQGADGRAAGTDAGRTGDASERPAGGRDELAGTADEGLGTVSAEGTGEDAGDGRASAGKPASVQSESPDGGATDSAGRVAVENVEAEMPAKGSGESRFEQYRSAVRIKGASPHPAPLAESSAMASVSAPKTRYRPNLPQALIASGQLSDAQLETVTRAGAAHERMLASGERQGFFVGDGTGVGKGAQIAGILLDNWRQGRTRAVWVSENKPLMTDAKRDLDWVTRDAGTSEPWESDFGSGQLRDLGTIKGEIQSEKGILFATYSTLGMKGKEVKDANGNVVAPAVSRVDQVVTWLGEDFDGVVAFDESHNMANAMDQKGNRGIKKASQKAMAGIELQRRLPKARVVYFSATGATDVSNLAYLQRLGLWGEGTAFPSQDDFVAKMTAGGVAAMEVVAKDMKAMGMYLSRNLSYDGVTYDTLEHTLTPTQRTLFDTMAGAWQTVLADVNAAMEESGSNEDAAARSRALSGFWGSHQRFFNQVLTAMSGPSLLANIEGALKQGRSAVLQLVNTNEAVQERRLGQAADADIALEDVDLTSRDILMQYLANSFPTTRYEAYTDENGNEKTRPVTDAKGNPVEDPDAVARRDKLLEELGSLPVPEGILEQVINQFGSAAVAEITGRKRRLVRHADGSVELEKLGKASRDRDAQDFADGKKRILIFSDAGGTGRSYHASNRFKNQQKRVHYLVQPGWRADRAVQGTGRTHRTNQAVTPHYMLVTTNMKAQRRFIATVARRLDQLGALTKGQRDTTSQGMFSAEMNLENEYGVAALEILVKDLASNDVNGMTMAEFEAQTGLRLTDEDGNVTRDSTPTVPRFLNRLLSMRIAEADLMFDAFFERLTAQVEYAREQGMLDAGMETLRGTEIRKVDDQVVPGGAADAQGETRYVKLEVDNPAYRVTFTDLPRGVPFYRQKRSGKLYAIGAAISVTNRRTGEVVPMVRRIGVTGGKPLPQSELAEKYARVSGSREQFRDEWDRAFEAAPATKTTTHHLVSGALLPVWDRLPGGRTQIYRVQVSDSGEMLLGREIGAAHVSGTLRALGVGVEVPQRTPREWLGRIVEQGDSLELANGWRLARKQVSGEARIEVVAEPGTALTVADRDLIRDMGGFVEMVAFKSRVFLPTGDVGVMERMLAHKPVVEVIEGGGKAAKDQDGGIRESAIPIAYDLQTEVDGYGSSGKVQASRRRYSVSSSQRAFDLEPPAGVPAKEGVRQQAKDSFFVQYRSVPTAEVRVGLERVNDAQDAAHVFAPYRKHAQETMLALVVDGKGKPISIIRHSKGLKDQSNVDPATIAAAIAATDGAASVWFGHNHPSADPAPSTADLNITRAIAKALDGAGVDARGHIVIGGTRMQYFPMSAHPGVEPAAPIIPRPRKRTIPVTERVLRRAPRGERHAITSPETANAILKQFDLEDGALLLNNKHTVVGILRLSPHEMAELRKNGGVPRILKAIDGTNASAVIIASSEESMSSATNLVRYFHNLGGGIRVLDAIHVKKGEGRWSFASSAERGMEVERATGPFFQLKKGRTGARRPTLSATTLQTKIDRITRRWAGLGSIRVRVVQQEEDMPASALAKLERMRRVNPDATPKAVFIAGENGAPGEIVLVADNLGSVKEAFVSLLHESRGHYGVRGVFGDNLQPFLDQLAKDRPDDVAKYAEQYGLDMSQEEDRRTAAEELLAHMAEDSAAADLPFLRRVYQAMRAAVRKMGIHLRLTNGDLREVLMASRRFVEGGAGKQIAPTAGVNRFMFAGTQAVNGAAWRSENPADTYPVAGKIVDGREVINADAVPNIDSIEATFEKYETLDGIRAVPVAAFDSLKTTDLFYDRRDISRARVLAKEIRDSNQITPLIVAVDSDGPYILEGAHRAAALHEIGAKSFPAIVVLDTESFGDARTTGPRFMFAGQGADIRFKLADGTSVEAISNRVRQVHDGVGNEVDALLTDPKKVGNRLLMRGLGALTLRMLTEKAQKWLAAPQLFDAGRVKYETEKNKMQAKAQGLMEDWIAHPRKEVEKTADLMHDSTVDGVDASQEELELLVPDANAARQKITSLKQLIKDTPGEGGGRLQAHWREQIRDLERQLAQDASRRKAHQDLHARFLKLPEWARGTYNAKEKKWEGGIYSRARDDYKEMDHRMKEAIYDRIRRATMTDEQDVMKRLMDIKVGDKQARTELIEALAKGVIRMDIAKNGRVQLSLDEAFVHLLKGSGIGIQRQLLKSLNASLKKKQVMIAKVRAEFEANRVTGVYFPLQRFGDYYASVERPAEDGESERAFVMAESEAGLDAEVAAYAKDGWTLRHRGKKSSQVLRDIDGASEGFVADVVSQLAEADQHGAADVVYQTFLDTLPYLSQRKHFIHRQKTPGYTRDAARSYAHNMAHLASQISRMEAQPDLTGALDLMRAEIAAKKKQAGFDGTREDRFYEEFERRYQWIMSPSNAGWAQGAAALGFTWFLGASPAAAMVNLTQTAIVAFPELAAKYGPRKAGAALLRSTKEVIGARRKWKGRRDYEQWETLTTDEREALQYWLDRGDLDVTQTHALMGLAEEGSYNYNPKTAKALELIGLPFHEAEVINREATMLAGYRLARRVSGYFDEMAARSAAAHSENAHFDYANANRARFMQGNAQRVLFLFKSYSLHMTWYLANNAWEAVKGESKEVRREAGKRLAGVLGMTGLFAGSLGMPTALTAPLFLVAEAAHALMKGDDDEPWDAAVAWRDFLADFGLAGKVLDRGAVNALTGLDMASRTGLDDLWFRMPDRDMEGRDAYHATLEAAIGPIGGMVQNALFLGPQMMAEGEVWRGVEKMVPKAIADPLRAMRYAGEGVQTMRGNPVVARGDLSWFELFMKANGFNPDQISAQYDANSAAKNYEQRILKQRGRLLARFGMATLDRDADGRKAALQAIREYNAGRPAKPIDRATLRRSLTARARYRRENDSGVFLNKDLHHLRGETRVAM